MPRKAVETVHSSWPISSRREYFCFSVWRNSVDPRRRSSGCKSGWYLPPNATRAERVPVLKPPCLVPTKHRGRERASASLTRLDVGE